MSPSHLNVLAALVLLPGILSGCAAQNANLPPANLAAQQKNFANGDASLDCSLGCSGNYGFHRQEMKALYNSDKWSNLSKEVLNIGENIDQAWFYLGAAAEGQGYNEAAQRYYFISIITHFRCSRGLNVCDGLDLPAATEQRILDLDAKMVAQPEFSQLSVPPASSGSSVEIHLLPSDGVLKAPALLDSKIPLLFAVDSGSSVVTLPEGLGVLMFDHGLLERKDVLGIGRTVLGNGATVPVIIVKIASLQIGGVTLKNFVGGISPGPGELLLGQSFLDRFKSWSIDNSRQTLILQSP